VRDCLGNKEFAAIPLNVQGQSDLHQLNIALGCLAAHGIDFDMSYLYANRDVRALPVFDNISADADALSPKPPGKHTISLPQGLPMLAVDEKTVQLFREAVGTAPGGSQKTPVPGQGEKPGVMASFMDTMDMFLEQQQEVMARYLSTKRK